jgi:hypothetical protein
VSGTNADSEPVKELYAEADDVTLANPFGPARRCREAVMARARLRIQPDGVGHVVAFDELDTRVRPAFRSALSEPLWENPYGGVASTAGNWLCTTFMIGFLDRTDRRRRLRRGASGAAFTPRQRRVRNVSAATSARETPISTPALRSVRCPRVCTAAGPTGEKGGDRAG